MYSDVPKHNIKEVRQLSTR